MRKTNGSYSSIRGEHRSTFRVKKAERITLLLGVHKNAVSKKTNESILPVMNEWYQTWLDFFIAISFSFYK